MNLRAPHQRQDLLIAGGLALLLQACFCVLIAWWWLAGLEKEKTPPPVHEKVTILLHPEQFQRPKPKPLPKKKIPPKPPETKRFARTQAQQESEEPISETRYFGERNTKARSETSSLESPLDVPNIKGKEPRKALDTFEESYQEGESSGPSASARNEDASQRKKTQDSQKEQREQKELKQEAKSPLQQELYQTNQQIEQASVKKRAQETKDPGPDKKTQKKKEKREKSESRPQKASSAVAKREVKKAKLTGSIRRQGQSSLEVKSSLEGKYHAALGRAVEKEWQKNVIKHREHMGAGYLMIRFLVSDSGTIKGIRFVEDQASAIQKGITLQSVQDAKVPSFSKKLKQELNGKPLELYYTFYF